MVLPIDIIPDTFIKDYNLTDIDSNVKVYVRIEKGMYGLPQYGILDNQKLQLYLKKYGYYTCEHSVVFWNHENRPITFTLVVDDFGVKFEGKKHANHLLTSLRKYYLNVTVDLRVSLYCGIELNWDYKNCVDISMTNYIQKLLKISSCSKKETTTYPIPMDQTQLWGQQNNILSKMILLQQLTKVKFLDPNKHWEPFYIIP